jgi:2-polyprenyl-3-methyl-5-hydroxy-6-metoxy-1,4-benzoquinol methylase
VGDDWTTPLGTMPPPVGPGQHRVVVTWNRGTGAAHLVFRNGGASRPGVFRIDSVALAPVDAPGVHAPRVVEEMLDEEGRLDVARLRDAVARANPLQGDDDAVFERLRQKWGTVPAGLLGRRGTAELGALPDEELRDLWLAIHREATTGDGFAVRGWYHTLYRDVLRGKRVLEIGSGMGIDGIEFARHGADITFVDIVETNLETLRRLCRMFGVARAQFVYLERLSSLDRLEGDYDVVWCQGSLINAPFDFVRRECAAILPHLKPGGRWIELAYPRERWVRDGRPPFRVWGTMTDGEGTPWVEWYDLDRLLRRLEPARFAPILAMNFHRHEFNWFDLQRID